MLSSAVRTFTDPDEFATSVRQGNLEVTVTERGTFSSGLIRIDLHRLWMQHFTETLPQITHVADWGGRAAISFQTSPGSSLSRYGIEMPPGTVMRHAEAQSYYLKSGGCGYGAMSLPVADLALVGSALTDCDLLRQKSPQLISPPLAAMAKLQRLHAAAMTLAKDSPEIIIHPEAARGLEHALTEAMVDCLSIGSLQKKRDLTIWQHAKIMQRFHRLIAEKSDEPLYIPELCLAVGASERTLRICCVEQLGMGPKQYLMLRRLNFAHQALIKSDPTQTTVTDIATQYGFWQFGRFAGTYKSFFGELPSATLARPVNG